MKSNPLLHRAIPRRIHALALTAAVCCIAFSKTSAHAQTLVSTGLDASNTLIGAGGVADAHWTVSEQAGGFGAAQTVYPNNADWFSGWIANGPSSDWIARNASITDNGPAPYTFSTTFDLTGLDPTTAEIFGSWAIDDQGSLALNGNTISTIGNGDWGALTNFSVFSGSLFFLPGINTLSMTITADDDFLDAARLQGAVFANSLPPNGTPEPGSLALFAGLTATGIGIAARKRRK
jgi:hypothetical protein